MREGLGEGQTSASVFGLEEAKKSLALDKVILFQL
jgi:hypothetical protein